MAESVISKANGVEEKAKNAVSASDRFFQRSAEIQIIKTKLYIMRDTGIRDLKVEVAKMDPRIFANRLTELSQAREKILDAYIGFRTKTGIDITPGTDGFKLLFEKSSVELKKELGEMVADLKFVDSALKILPSWIEIYSGGYTKSFEKGSVRLTEIALDDPNAYEKWRISFKLVIDDIIKKSTEYDLELAMKRFSTARLDEGLLNQDKLIVIILSNAENKAKSLEERINLLAEKITGDKELMRDKEIKKMIRTVKKEIVRDAIKTDPASSA